MKVNVTQYYRPYGWQETHEIEIRDECAEHYQQIGECGARLTAEQLMTGVVSQAIECEEFDFDMILTPGSDFEQNKRALETLILRFDKEKCKSMGMEIKMGVEEC